MEKLKLTDSVISMTGRRVKADRTVCKETVTYRPHGRCWDGEDVNAIVYDLMIIACYDMMTVGTVLYGGEYTAAEMAGKIGYLHQYVESSDYKTVKIETKTFCCTYHVGEAFVQMAEWEGVMNLSPKKCHRFTVEGKELPKGAKIEPYKRCHGYKPTHISLVMYERRINEKFEVLGRLYQSLTSEGMRKALSVCAAASLFDNKSYEVKAMVKTSMRWKLWKDYAKKDDASMMPVAFSATDFQCGPECYKQVDSKYVQVLVDHWNKLVADSPMPEWPKQGDWVQFKNREKMQKKYQGKYLCEGMTASLSTYGDRIEWRASLRVKKYDNEYFTPSMLEPAPEKPVKKTKAKTKAKKSESKAKVVKHQPSAIEHQTSIAEQLRQALLARLAA